MSRSCLVLIFFVFCIGMYVSAITVPFQDCGSASVTVTNLDFDCEGNVPEPCKFIKGNTYSGTISFRTTAEIPNGKIVLHAIIGSVSLSFPLDNPNICSNHNLTCPIASSENEALTMSVKVPSIPLTTNFVAKFEIQPSSGSSEIDHMCVEFLAQIADSNDIEA